MRTSASEKPEPSTDPQVRLRPWVVNVNDREIPRYVTEQLLRRAGFEVLSLGTGEEVLALGDRVPDMFLLDVHLPGMDGFEVCRRLKASEPTAHVPVLMTSAAFVSSQSKTEGLDSGADGYLVQPFEAAELIATVRALMRVKSAERLAYAALRSRDDFLGTASHELRTPVMAVHLLLERLLRRANRPEGVDRGDLLLQLDKIQNNVRRLSGLVTSLLDLSRLDSGALKLQLEPVDLTQVVRQVTTQLEEELARSGCTLRMGSQGEMTGQWDRLLVEQVVTNLISNALKYGPGSEVSVELEASPDGQRVELKVTDGGMGIDPSDHSRIFDRFERAQISANRPGFGLGLWIVRQIVEAMGGTIRVESALGHGAAFFVSLPRSQPADPAGPATAG